MLFSPLADPSDKFSENVNLLTQDLAAHPMDLDAFTELSENQIRTLVTDSKIVSSERVKATPFDYHKLIYSGKQGMFHLKFEQHYWVVDNKAHVLTFTAELESFDDYQEVAENILNSLQLDL